MIENQIAGALLIMWFIGGQLFALNYAKYVRKTIRLKIATGVYLLIALIVTGIAFLK